MGMDARNEFDETPNVKFLRLRGFMSLLGYFV